MVEGNGTSLTYLNEDYVGKCEGNWNSPNHVYFQIGHAAIMAAYLAPHGIYGVLFMHGALVTGFLLLTTWAWAVLCAPDVFSWNFSFMTINAIQVLYILYHLRPVKFSSELEQLYKSLFSPMKVPRISFKKLVSPEFCTLMTLHPGETYARQEVTKSDKLGLLISGKAKVLCNGQVLHLIEQTEFFDSPEFESTTRGDEKFHVTIMAVTPCQYLCWQRQSLEYLFATEQYLATVLGTLVDRDITNKLYLLNDKLHPHHQRKIDIRLLSIPTVAIAGTWKYKHQKSFSSSNICASRLEEMARTSDSEDDPNDANLRQKK